LSTLPDSGPKTDENRKELETCGLDEEYIGEFFYLVEQYQVLRNDFFAETPFGSSFCVYDDNKLYLLGRSGSSSGSKTGIENIIAFIHFDDNYADVWKCIRQACRQPEFWEPSQANGCVENGLRCENFFCEYCSRRGWMKLIFYFTIPKLYFLTLPLRLIEVLVESFDLHTDNEDSALLNQRLDTAMESDRLFDDRLVQALDSEGLNVESPQRRGQLVLTPRPANLSGKKLQLRAKMASRFDDDIETGVWFDIEAVLMKSSMMVNFKNEDRTWSYKPVEHYVLFFSDPIYYRETDSDISLNLRHGDTFLELPEKGDNSIRIFKPGFREAIGRLSFDGISRLGLIFFLRTPIHRTSEDGRVTFQFKDGTSQSYKDLYGSDAVIHSFLKKLYMSEG
jgi:hypothetical protein